MKKILLSVLIILFISTLAYIVREKELNKKAANICTNQYRGAEAILNEDNKQECHFFNGRICRRDEVLKQTCIVEPFVTNE
ncbi:hypothetical protein KKG22_05350 [Patescibacteria group bacterium]|nr:hypothetical protein [Patescibacteria group bacterium]MBU1721552.1 hypothetical protein [Patescibacteria group bacterium]MBU1901470.1 hypothetical protein [Patescibacteria group bacterium]